MREVIDSVHYRAASARYKIYIVDEVHMLSNAAFNALLKTLEEPPAHVKFIFATTEIRKVPVTVLSRCQRFDLRRIEPEVMIDHLRAIAEKEDAQIAGDALALIARAAEGSVRDAMSLLDQAISHGAGETTAEEVRAMLGLADRGRVMDLFDMIMKGEAAAALTELGAQYSDGADPMAVLRDLAELTHWVSVIQITPDAVEDATVGPDERARGQAFAQGLQMRSLTRMWQMLLKALEEVGNAPNSMMAAEMAVIRLTHVADLPSPDDLVRKLRDAPPPAGSAPAPRPAPSGGGGPVARGSAQPAIVSVPDPALERFATFPQVVELIRANRDVKLLVEVETGVRLAAYAPGRIEFEPTPAAASDLSARLAGRLQGWTGVRWIVTLVPGGGAPSIAELRDRGARQAETDAMAHPMTQAILQAFPGAQLVEVRTRATLAQDAADAGLPEVEDEWDPFDEA